MYKANFILTNILAGTVSLFEKNTFKDRNKKYYIWKNFFVEGQRGKTGCLKSEMVPDVISDRSQLT